MILDAKQRVTAEIARELSLTGNAPEERPEIETVPFDLQPAEC
jgi:hypothetical protein